MPKSCSAYNCTNRYSSKNPDLTFHRFPFSKPSVLKQWLDNIGREDFQPKRHMVICSHHFTPDCFSGLGNRKNLLWNAVPTVFTFPPSNTKRRKSRKKLKKQLSHSFPEWEELLLEKAESQRQEVDQDVCVTPVSAEGIKHTVEKHLNPVSQLQVLGPFDHSYALSDPIETKARLFSTLDINRQLHKRLKIKCQVIRRMRLKLCAARRELASLRAGRSLMVTCGTAL
ncbi:hypothetical protein MATL_G00106530 [Megalops atlanticus]|uniref:THAP-type domain-containing protein n=1 Tax=Megalops atlanticus TaxID=7932 RepID=A0A9D3PZ09_MEGAT|nr:hypothetical protein MATL_G00106530 [Megalops atlanticus]